jgi:transcriptional regulator with XRE-family HTH domain
MLTAVVVKLAYMTETTGDRIKKIRKAMRMTTRQFGAKIGVSHAAVSLWENGNTKNLRNDHLKKISEISGRRMEWIISGDLPEMKRSGLADHDELIQLLEIELKREGPNTDLSKKLHRLLKRQ